MEDLRFFWENEHYNGPIYLFQPPSNNSSIKKPTGALPQIVALNLRVNRTESSAELVLGNVLLDEITDSISGNKMLITKDVFVGTIAKYDTIEGYSYNQELLNDVSRKFDQLTTTSFYEISSFVKEYCLKTNMFMYNLLMNDDNFYKKMKEKINPTGYGTKKVYSRANCFRNILSTDLIAFEKIVKSLGLDFFVVNIDKKGIELNNDGKKLKQIMQVPNRVLEFIKVDYAETYNDFKNICGICGQNSGILMIDFVEKVLKISNCTKSHATQFIKLVSQILVLRPEITDLKGLLGYLMRQRYYYTGNDALEPIWLPIDEAITMRDYYKMAKDSSIEIELFPQNINREHDIVLENTKILNSKELNNAFIEAVQQYKGLEDTTKTFIIRCPIDINDLVLEGNKMHHCVGTYVDRVIAGAKVMFLRDKNSPEESLVTFEVDDALDFLQIKQKFNEDVTDEVILKALLKWQSKIRKNMGVK